MSRRRNAHGVPAHHDPCGHGTPRAGDTARVDRSGLPPAHGGLVRIQPHAADVEIVSVNVLVARVYGPAGETIEPVRLLRRIENANARR